MINEFYSKIFLQKYTQLLLVFLQWLTFFSDCCENFQLLLDQKTYALIGPFTASVRVIWSTVCVLTYEFYFFLHEKKNLNWTDVWKLYNYVETKDKWNWNLCCNSSYPSPELSTLCAKEQNISC